MDEATAGLVEATGTEGTGTEGPGTEATGTEGTGTEGTSAEGTGASGAGGCGCGGCGCGGGAPAGVQALPLVAGSPAAPPAAAVEPTDLDVRPLPPAERHAQVTAAVGALLPGEAVVVAADHDPARLLERLAADEPGRLAWEYRAQGPDVWRVLVSRLSCC